jgi:hypothetical protein
VTKKGEVGFHDESLGSQGWMGRRKVSKTAEFISYTYAIRTRLLPFFLVSGRLFVILA